MAVQQTVTLTLSDAPTGEESAHTMPVPAWVVRFRSVGFVVLAVLVLLGLVVTGAPHMSPTPIKPSQLSSGGPGWVEPTGLSTNPEWQLASLTFFHCMSDAGFNAFMQSNGQGLITEVGYVSVTSVQGYDGQGIAFNSLSSPDTTSSPEMASSPDTTYSFEMTTDATRVASVSASILHSTPTLVIDGADRSDDYAACLRESAYTEQPIFAIDQEQVDAAMVDAVTRANTDWAQCALAHGWATSRSVEKPSQPADHLPTIYLPNSITYPQLRALLAVCPNFDPAQEASFTAWEMSRPTSYPATYTPPPNIDFAPSKLQGHYPPGWMPPLVDQGLSARLSTLYEILSQARAAYHASMGD
ncbi:MAG: hypothetical protein FWD75_03835 [Propionibacteriaceae bacterium]|nr:hypothetical protein [Propionibacteriaceae bacterium]